MNREDNLKPFEPGTSGNPNGRPIGAKNRSTIARKILEMRGLLSAEKMTALKAKFPEITDKMTVEEIMTIVMADGAISGDDKAYKAVMDSAYGAPKAELEHSGSIALPITGFTIIQDNEPNHQATTEAGGGDSSVE